MKNLLELSKAYLKKVFSDLHNVIVGIVVVAIVSGGGVYLFFRSLWTQLKSIAQSPTPLWASGVLCLGLLVYIRVAKVQAKLKEVDQTSTSKTPPYEIQYFDDSKFRWKYKIFHDDSFEVDENPFCLKHDLQFVCDDTYKFCPSLSECGCKLPYKHFNQYFAQVESFIDRQIRNHKKQV